MIILNEHNSNICSAELHDVREFTENIASVVDEMTREGHRVKIFYVDDDYTDCANAVVTTNLTATQEDAQRYFEEYVKEMTEAYD